MSYLQIQSHSQVLGVKTSTYGFCTRVLSRSAIFRLFPIPWTVACQAPLSMGFSRQEYWSGLPHPSPGDLSDPGTKCMPLASPALADGFFTTGATWEALWGMQSITTSYPNYLGERGQESKAKEWKREMCYR